MLRLATHPTSSLLFRQRAVSVVRCHCQLFDCFGLGSRPWWGEPPRETSNAQPSITQMSAFPECRGSATPLHVELIILSVHPPPKASVPSSVRTEPVLTPYGVLLERMLMASKRSREKNCPTPARIAKRPVPKTSHAMPKR